MMQQPPNDPESDGRREMSACACTVAEKYLRGSQGHPQHTGLPMAWRGMLRELRSCCPGFTDIEYGIELNRAFTGPRGTASIFTPTP